MVSRKTIQSRMALVGLSLGLCAANASATVDTLTPVADTFITIHPGLGGPTSNHGSDAYLAVIGPNAGNPVFTVSMVRFDLSAYAGRTVNGPVTFSMYVQGSDFNNPTVPPRNIDVRNIAGTWNEATVTANNASFVPGAVLDTQSIHYLTSADDRYVSWTLPASYVQNWIDLPSSNNGLYIQNPTGGPLNDLQFGSRESAHTPQLTLTLIPMCYANCDDSTVAPVLNANDFLCFLNQFAQGQPYANCDGSTVLPVLTPNDFQCFLNQFAAGCP
jgi:hypothetical protein